MIENKPYVKGLRILYDKNTGEKIPVENVIKPVSSNYFWKVKMMDFLTSLDIIGNKSVIVYSFVLGHINQNTNKLKMTNKQIQHGIKKEYIRQHGNTKKNRKKSSITIVTISRAISKLEHIKIKKNNKPLLMRKRYGRYGRHSYIMINPAMLMRGSENKRNGLLIQYKSVNNKKKKATKKYNNLKNHINKQQDKIRRNKVVLMKEINQQNKLAKQLHKQNKEINK